MPPVSTPPRRMRLNLFFSGRGHHEAAWRHPAAAGVGLADIRAYQAQARTAEAGLFDSLFLADQLALGAETLRAARPWLEPLTVLSALAVSTSRIGLIATASTTYTEPFNLARQFASLDHISNGRIGWNIVTTWAPASGRNYGDREQLSHAERYGRAEEYMQVVKALWDSWAADAVIDDRAGGVYARPERVRAIDHTGAHYDVAGPLILPRCPQGRPVLVQAGSSETGRAFAARHADAVFTAQMEKATAVAFYADMKTRIAGAGRVPEQVHILPGLCPVIGGTEAEAERAWQELNDLSDPEIGRARLSARFGGHDFSHLALDRPLAPEDFPDPATVEAARSRTEVIVGLVKSERLTLRQLLGKLASARGHMTQVGTPEQIADFMEDWFTTGAADGFNVMPPIAPLMLDVFVSEVIPLLQRRGLFHRAYEGETLREHYGLAMPESRFST